MGSNVVESSFIIIFLFLSYVTDGWAIEECKNKFSVAIKKSNKNKMNEKLVKKRQKLLSFSKFQSSFSCVLLILNKRLFKKKISEFSPCENTKQNNKYSSCFLFTFQNFKSCIFQMEED